MSKIYLAEKSSLGGIEGRFCTCSTAAAVAGKTAELDGFTLKTGAQAAVKFTYSNTAASPTLNINGTGAKSIYYHNSAIPASMLMGGGVYLFVYDGSRWQLTGNHLIPSEGADSFFTDLSNSGRSGAHLIFESSGYKNSLFLSCNSYEATAYLGKIDFSKYLMQGYKRILFSFKGTSRSSLSKNGMQLIISSSQSVTENVVRSWTCSLSSSNDINGTDTMNISNLNGSYYFIVHLTSGGVGGDGVTATFFNLYLLT